MLSKLKIHGDLAADLGLEDQEISRLGRYVVLAGKNGSGKSRILRYVKESVDAFNSDPRLDTEIQRSLENNLRYAPTNAGHANLADNEQRVLAARRSVFFEGRPSPAVPFVPAPGELHDPHHNSNSQKEQFASDFYSAPATLWPQRVLSYIETLQERSFNARHPDMSHIDDSLRRTSVAQYDELSSAIARLLGVDVSREISGRATLFGRPINESGLSTGQKVLLQLAAAMHAQAANFDESIIIMDEPENHLHPRALVDLLSFLEAAAPKVQLWIATHSVPLLAYLNSRSSRAIWSVDGGSAKQAGRNPEIVLRGLLGDEENISQLSSFMALPSEIAVNNFAFQCLFPPAAVMTSSADPQLQQICNVLHSVSAGSGVRLLDYGAGKGRLVEAIVEHNQQGGAFDYCAFDEFDGDEAICREVIAGAFGGSDGRYFNSISRLSSSGSNGGIDWYGTFDCVVMTNVLHEINPLRWQSIFTPDGELHNLLAPNGYYLIVEDQLIPVGEFAHQFGFILLNNQELSILFGVTAADRAAGLFKRAEARDGRLTAHLISKDLACRITPDSKRAALRSVVETAKREIDELRRKSQRTYEDGLRHAQWTMQLANATLALAV